MKKGYRIRLLLTSISFLALFLGMNHTNEARAAEEGGQVQTDAGIVMRKAKKTTDSSDKPPIPKKKPVGRLPQTGDLVKISLLFSGGVLTLVTLLLLFWRRKAGRSV